jgi:hypothetical protein
MVGFGSIVPVVPCAFPAREGALINHCLPQMRRQIQADTVVGNPHG